MGTLLRVFALALPLGLPEPLGLLLVNVLGAFALGVVVGAARSPRLRLLLGTGLLGGFTSYSAMILLASPGHSGTAGTLGLGLGLAAATVIVGPLVAALGLRLSKNLNAPDPASAPLTAPVTGSNS